MNGLPLTLGFSAILAGLAAGTRRRGSRAQEWTDEDAYAQGRMWEGANPPEVRAVTLDWRYEPAVSASRLVRLMGHKGAWTEWLEDEDDARSERRREPGVPWLPAFADWWLSTPNEEPVVLIEDMDGDVVGIWDGWHRTAVSIVDPRSSGTMPAFVGRLREPLPDEDEDE